VLNQLTIHKAQPGTESVVKIVQDGGGDIAWDATLSVATDPRFDPDRWIPTIDAGTGHELTEKK
jgi:hypothetical protein